MAVLLPQLLDSPAVECLPHKTWTRDEVAVLESSGLMAGAHFELLDGELIDKLSKNRRHVDGTRRTRKALAAAYGEDRVDQEATIDVAPADNRRNEPEPDIVVLDRNPLASEVTLVVEVADSTLQYDLTTKAQLYARAGIPHYWILDLNAPRLIALSNPADGEYRTRAEHAPDSRIEPPGTTHSIPVAAFLP